MEISIKNSIKHVLRTPHRFRVDITINGQPIRLSSPFSYETHGIVLHSSYGYRNPEVDFCVPLDALYSFSETLSNRFSFEEICQFLEGYAKHICQEYSQTEPEKEKPPAVKGSFDSGARTGDGSLYDEPVEPVYRVQVIPGETHTKRVVEVWFWMDIEPPSNPFALKIRGEIVGAFTKFGTHELVFDIDDDPCAASYTDEEILEAYKELALELYKDSRQQRSRKFPNRPDQVTRFDIVEKGCLSLSFSLKSE